MVTGALMCSGNPCVFADDGDMYPVSINLTTPSEIELDYDASANGLTDNLSKDKYIQAFAIVASLEDAEGIAEKSGACLVSFDNGVAVYTIAADDKRDMAFDSSVQSVGSNLSGYGLCYDTFLETADDKDDSVISYIGNNWQLDMVKAYDAWGISKGYGAKVGVIDTGIRATHEDLMSNICGLYNASSLSNNDPGTDHYDHGTPVSGIICGTLSMDSCFGIAPFSSVYSLKVAKDSEPESNTAATSSVIRAINKCIEEEVDVINISMCAAYNSTNDTAAKEALRNALLSAYNHGITVVCAAGNNGDSTPMYPAAFDTAIAVGALSLTQDGENKWKMALAGSSNYGNWVDIYAPGAQIYSPSAVNDNSYRMMGGTSAAAPLVAGVAALIYSKFPSIRYEKNSNTADIVKQMLKNGTDGKEYTGPSNRYVIGCLDAYKAVNMLVIRERNNGFCCSTVSNDTPIMPGRKIRLVLGYFNGEKVKKKGKIKWGFSGDPGFTFKNGTLKCTKDIQEGSSGIVTADYGGIVYKARFVAAGDDIGSAPYFKSFSSRTFRNGEIIDTLTLFDPENRQACRNYMIIVKSRKPVDEEKDPNGRTVSFTPLKPGKYKVVYSFVNGKGKKYKLTLRVS